MKRSVKISQNLFKVHSSSQQYIILSNLHDNFSHNRRQLENSAYEWKILLDITSYVLDNGSSFQNQHDSPCNEKKKKSASILHIRRYFILARMNCDSLRDLFQHIQIYNDRAHAKRIFFFQFYGSFVERSNNGLVFAFTYVRL